MSRSSRLGRYQFHSQNSSMVAGKRMPRITVASRRIATAGRTHLLQVGVCPVMKRANTATITMAELSRFRPWP